MNYRMSKNETVTEALTSTVTDALDIWQKAAIPTTQKCNAVNYLNQTETLQTWNNLIY